MKVCWILTSIVAMVVSFATSAAEPDIARGRYLLNGIVACGNCHSPRGADGNVPAGQELSGGLVIETPGFRAVAPNITPDKETGIGLWSDAQIAAGVRPDGRTLVPLMAFDWYRTVNDGDMNALVAYLRTLKAVAN